MTYSYPEVVAAVVYLGIAVAMIAISGTTFDHEADIKVSGTVADSYQKSAAAYTKDIASLVENNWSASISSPVSSTFTHVDTETVSISRHLTPVTTKYLKASVSVASLLAAASPTTVTMSITTELNTIPLSLDMNMLDNKQNFTLTCLGDSTFNSCNATKMCEDKYGEAAILVGGVTVSSSDANNGEHLCEVPRMSNNNCILLTKRRNDAGTLVWSRDFTSFGCDYPWTSRTTILRKTTTTLDFTIRATQDPFVQKQVYSKGESLKFKVEKKDHVPQAVGILMCGIFMLVGFITMCWQLVPHFWALHKEGKPLCEKHELALGEEEDDDGW